MGRDIRCVLCIVKQEISMIKIFLTAIYDKIFFSLIESEK